MPPPTLVALISADGVLLAESRAPGRDARTPGTVGLPVWQGLWPVEGERRREELAAGIARAAGGQSVRVPLPPHAEIRLTPLYRGGEVHCVLGEEFARPAERTEAGAPSAAGPDDLSMSPGAAGALAHEINNRVGGIKNAVLLLRDVVPPDSEYFEYLALIEQELDRMTRFVGALYDRATR